MSHRYVRYVGNLGVEGSLFSDDIHAKLLRHLPVLTIADNTRPVPLSGLHHGRWLLVHTCKIALLFGTGPWLIMVYDEYRLVMATTMGSVTNCAIGTSTSSDLVCTYDYMSSSFQAESQRSAQSLSLRSELIRRYTIGV